MRDFKGGIQKGTSASTEQSKALDGDVKSVAKKIALTTTKVFYEFGNNNKGKKPHIVQKNRLPEFIEKGFEIGCEPDGGMWFSSDRSNKERKLLFVFEAKHQQDRGNAIERWCKNHDLCHALNPDVTYVTFATGLGAKEGGVLRRFGSSMKTAFGEGIIFHYSENGFSEEQIYDIMIKTMGLDK